MQLPLFPLNSVLFPGCPLDLQLFEPRYLDMLARCLRQGSGFGVVGLLDGREVGPAARRFAEIGCEALIRDWQQLSNGLLGIRVEGGRRFRVQHSSVQPDQLLLAEVEWLAEDWPERPLEDDQTALLGLLQALGEHPLVHPLGLGRDIVSQQALANQLSYLLPLPVADKLELLAETDCTRRLARLQRLVAELQGATGD